MAANNDTPVLLKFKAGTTINTVDRQTVKDIADVLGLDETGAIHYALARLRESILPAYPADAPDLSESALRKIREANSHLEERFEPTAKLFDGF